jgi:hypothetical protein
LILVLTGAGADMALFTNISPPNFPTALETYDRRTLENILKVLRLYLTQLNSEQQLNVTTLNINVNTLPTEADIADLRSGDIYRDTTADNAIKVKP